jgi:hypothetical protein
MEFDMWQERYEGTYETSVSYFSYAIIPATGTDADTRSQVELKLPDGTQTGDAIFNLESTSVKDGKSGQITIGFTDPQLDGSVVPLIQFEIGPKVELTFNGL